MPESQKSDTAAYLAKKQFYNQLLTIYGRKPVLEALQDANVKLHRLHLAESNCPAPVLTDIIALAQNRGAEIVYHSRQALSRISKNSKQDQGVAADLICTGYQDYRHFLEHDSRDNATRARFELLALDRITNPQNLGMIIRSVCAGRIDGLLLPSQGGAKIDPLVIKASAGTVFKTTILRCEKLSDALGEFKQKGWNLYGLSSHARESIADVRPQHSAIYVLGNETDGVSAAVAELCDKSLAIPMNNGVESLNVAVAASLIAFRKIFLNHG